MKRKREISRVRHVVRPFFFFNQNVQIVVYMYINIQMHVIYDMYIEFFKLFVCENCSSWPNRREQLQNPVKTYFRIVKNSHLLCLQLKTH